MTEWREAPGHGSEHYLVSSEGAVVNVRTNELLQPNDRRRARLVLLAFVGPKPVGYEVCHLDDNPGNNCIDNLYYGTHSQNMLDCVRNGNHLGWRASNFSGANNGRAVLTAEQVLEARRLRAQDPKHWSYKRLAKQYGVSTAAMHKAIVGQSWRS